jgi:hypothetical protein
VLPEERGYRGLVDGLHCVDHATVPAAVRLKPHAAGVLLRPGAPLETHDGTESGESERPE